MLAAVFAYTVLSPSHAGAQQKTSAFQSWYERQVDNPTALPRAAHNAALLYRYVFVAGFLNEGFQVGYFNENTKALLEEGVKPDDIHIIFPTSGNGVEENVALLLRTIPNLAARGPQKLVLVGHSRGAVEVLAFAVSAPAFVRDRVEALFLVQGTFGGSSVADYITGSGHPLDQRMPTRRRAEMAIAARGGKLLDVWIDSGLQSLTHQRAAELWGRLIPPAGGPGSTPRLPHAMADKIFFIRSHRDPAQVSSILKATALYLRVYYGENDGMVEIKDQWIPGTGKVIATLDADHFALTLARPVSAQPSGARRAFTRALLMQISGAFDR